MNNRPLYLDSSHFTTVDDLDTLELCDEASVNLTAAIASLEAKVSEDPSNVRVRQALRYRRLAFQRVQERRRTLKPSSLIDIIAQLDPALLEKARQLQSNA